MPIDLPARLRQWRRELHQQPETAFDETWTSGYVADVLDSLGVTVARRVGGTGIVGTLTRGSSPHAVGLRAELDALPLPEQTAHGYASRNGRMHACGHDGHMAMLLGAAAVLAEQGRFDGTVRFFFQPAEEPGRGALAMIEDGLFDRFAVDQVYGLHNLPGLPAGHIHTRTGPIMGSEDTFAITVVGRGGHAARPHAVVDPLVVGAEIVLALQTLVSRSVAPADTAVVSCTDLVTDGSRNAIPTTVTIRGDARSFDTDVSALIERRMRELCGGISAAHGASADVVYRREFVPTVNDAACVAAAVAAATAVVGADRVDAHCSFDTTSEDFAHLAARVPGCFAFLGNGTEPDAGGDPLHSSRYDFNDTVAPVGVAYYVELVSSLMPAGDPR